ncbi:MAG: phosphoribosylaminoimidazolesuccinocarboxamide synthase, partial [Bacteroidota bacterium]
PQMQLSKEFVRQWLIEHGFQGLHGQSIPLMDAEWVQQISLRYRDLYEQLTGKRILVDMDHAGSAEPQNWLEPVQAWLSENGW